MGLDYTDGCVNIRDIGEFINLILQDKKLPEKKIYRGGSIDYIKSGSEIGNPKSIFNLRNGHDVNIFNADYYHFPMSNKIEKYDTNQKDVRKWLNHIIKEFENPELKYPVLIHCLSGKDRTGIVIAALLFIIGIDKKVIIEEYLLSDGEVNEKFIDQALNGMRNMEEYFASIDLKKVRINLLKEE